MPAARPLTPAVEAPLASPLASGRLLVAAGVVTFLCTLSAFLFFVLRDGSQIGAALNYRRVAAPPPVQAALVTPPALIAPSIPAPTPAKSSASNPDFVLTREGGRSVIGPLSVALLATNVAKGTYDVSGTVGGRNFTHRQVKVNEPLWIGAGRNQGRVRLVAQAVEENRISGYWSQSARNTATSQKSRSKKRSAHANR